MIMPMARRWWLAIGPCVLLGLCAPLALAGCALGWDEEDYCGPDGVCEPCASDSDCRVTLSCCGETMMCYSRHEDEFSICQLACYEPDPPPCRCEQGRCRFQ
jgi:hypothetical protein